jgi:uncharacterized lipoprotein NlpE involved in copper resistance
MIQRAICLVLVALTLVGCNRSNLPKTVPAEGVLTLDSVPVENATVVFFSDTNTWHATAVTNSKGEFSLDAFPTEKKGAVPGNYKIEVTKTVVGAAGGPEGESTVDVQMGLPKKYAQALTSGLTQSIPEAGIKDIKLELSSKAK